MRRGLFAGLLTAVLWTGANLRAAQKNFALKSGNFALEEISSEVHAQFRSMRLNRASNQWNVEVSLVNTGTNELRGPFVLLIDNSGGTPGIIGADGVDGSSPGKPFFDLTAVSTNGAIGAGGKTGARTLALAMSASAPSLETRVFGAEKAQTPLALARSLNQLGQPLGGVTVDEIALAGTNSHTTEPIFGITTVGQGSGAHFWKFSKPGYLPVWREKILAGQGIVLLPSARLAEAGTNSVRITAQGGGTVSSGDGALKLSYAPGTVAQDLTATLTTLDGQSLPAELPMGWSPLTAFWIEHSSEPAGPIEVFIKPVEALDQNDRVALVRLNETDAKWEVVQMPAPTGTNVLNTTLAVSGAYAIVVADSGAEAPPAAPMGSPLPSSVAPVVDFNSLTATGTATPESSPASRVPELVTARAEVTVQSTDGELPSGLSLKAQISDSYHLLDGTTRTPPEFVTDLFAYRRPGESIPGTLRAQFPLRPLLLFGSDELREAQVTAKIFPPAPFSGGVLGSSGGVLAVDHLRVLAQAGDLSEPQAGFLRELNATNFADFSSTNAAVVDGFELSISGIAPGKELHLETTAEPNSHFVLARILYDHGFYGLQPVKRMESDARGVLSGVEPSTGEKLDGITAAGQYLLLQVPTAQALVQGIAKNASGNPAGDLPVRMEGAPWLTFSRADGSYRLVAGIGGSELNVTDPETLDTGSARIQVSSANDTVVADVAAAALGPQVASIDPADGAAGVARITPITITFNKPVNPATLLADAILLVATNGQPVEASFTLNLKNTVATLLPSRQLEPGARYSIQLSTNIADLLGRALDGPRVFNFTTESDLLNRPPAQLIIYEPGATNIPPEVLAGIPAFVPGEEKDAVVVHGNPGSAEGEVPVILINQSSGETATVLSEADGSFDGIIRGSEDDFISASIQNSNHTQTYLPVSRQEFDNGFVGLYKGGGILEAQSDGGPVRVTVEPGAVSSRTKFELTAFPLQQVLQVLGGAQPEGGKVLGGVSYREELDPISVAADLSFPVNVADLDLPAGGDPAKATFALTVPTEIDGVTVYQMIDTMAFESEDATHGRLVTHSPPFVGLLLRQITASRQNSGTPSLLASFTGNPNDVAFGTFALQPVMGVMLIPILLSPDPPAKIAGRVLATPAGVIGALSADVKPVAGAFVRLRNAAAIGNQGFSRGEVFAISDKDGKYAIAAGGGTPTEVNGGPGFSFGFVVATHPAFPFQQPSAPFATALITKADLIFEQRAGNVPGVADNVAPLIRVAQQPRGPVAGLGENDGAILEVTAIDDFQVADVQITPEDFRALAGDAPLASSLLQAPILVEQPPGDPARVLRKFRVRAKEPGRAVYQINAVDAAGNSTFAPYAVTFRSAPGPTNELPNRVLFAWPPNGASNIPAATPITLRFTRPLLADQLTVTSWLKLTPPGAYLVTRVEPSEDRREITIFYSNGGAAISLDELELSISTEVATQFSSAGQKSGAFSYQIHFAPATQPIGVPPASGGPVTGKGSVLVGDYLYVLGVQNGEGILRQYRFIGPGFPASTPSGEAKLEFVADQSFAGAPTEIVEMPNYSLRRQNGEVLPPATYIAVFEGLVNETKVVRLFRVTPTTGALEKVTAANGVLTDAPAQIVKAKWDPPYIGYFELGADSTSVRLLNLNALFVGLEARSAGQSISIFPEGGSAGTDLNNDGDFADPGETAPLPDGAGIDNLGVEFSLATQNPNDRLQDFDFSADFALVAGVSRGIQGQPNSLIMLLGGEAGFMDQATARVSFSEDPKRVLMLARQKLLVRDEATNFNEIEADLALVSTVAPSTPEGAGDGVLIVVDISRPATPRILGRAKMPPGSGTLNSIVQNKDGKLALASSNGGLITLDPRLLLLAIQGSTGLSAAVQASAAGVGGPQRSFVADDSGLNASINGPEPQVAFTDPSIQIVSFHGIRPFDPRQLAAGSTRPPGIGAGDDGLDQLLFNAAIVTSPKVAQLADEAGAEDPDSHLYAVVRAPGIFGDELELAAASLDSMGHPMLPNPDFVAPTFVGEEKITTRFVLLAALEILKNTPLNSFSDLSSLVAGFSGSGIELLLKQIYANATAGKPVYPSGLVARRLSDDPTSSFFNVYLAGPICLLNKDLTPERLAALDQSDGSDGSMRCYLRASTYCWVGLGPKLKDQPLLGKFAASQDETFDLDLNARFPNLVNLALGAAQAAFTGNIKPVLQAAINFIDVHLDRSIQPGLHAFLDVGVIRRPLIVIPGVMGSRLKVDELINNDRWLSLFNAIFLASRMKDLILSAALTGKALEAYDVFDAVKSPTGSVISDSGLALLTHLQRQLGYRKYEIKGQKSLYLDQEPNLDSLEKMPDLFVFPYDWRQNNADSAALLKKYAELIREYHPDGDKVDIIAHSMGGLVARRFILENPDRVDRLITICSPLLGATKAVAAKRLGDFDDMALNLTIEQPTMKRIARHNPALDQLMPSKALFDLGLRPVLESGWDANNDFLPYETYEYRDYKQVLDHFLYHARKGTVNPDDDGYGPFEDDLYPDPLPIGGPVNNEAFHSFGVPGNNQDDWSGDHSSTRYFHIVASQRNPSTITRVRLTPSLRQLAPDEGSDVGIGFPPLNFADTELTDRDFPVASASDPEFPSAKVTSELSLSLILDRGPGDSTVPLLSQTRAFGSERSLNAPDSVVIPVLSKSPDAASEKGSSHVGVLSDPRCLNWVSRILREEVTSESMAKLRITANTSINEGGEISFSAVASNTQGAVFADNDFIWGTGDGGMFVGRTGGRHVYVEDGDYTLTCVAATKDGRAAATTSITIHVANVAPAIAFDNSPDSAAVGEPVTFRMNVTDPGLRDPQSFTWDFGDGSDLTGIPKDAFAERHLYKTQGTYTVTVEVEDEDGASSTATHQITINATPAARFAANRVRAFHNGTPTELDEGPGAFDEAAVLIRGHTADAGDLRVKSDADALFQINSDALVAFAKGLLLPEGQNAEQIIIRREPRDVGAEPPQKSTIQVKAEGEEVTLDATIRFTDGQRRCLHWVVPTTPGQAVQLVIPWQTVAAMNNDQLASLVSPQPSAAFPRNCDDDKGTTETVFRDEITQEMDAFRWDRTQVDGDPLTPDGDPTEIDAPPLPTETGPQTDTLVAQADSDDACEQSDKLLAVSLESGKIPITAASGTPQLLVVKDKQGNVTVTSNLQHPRVDDTASSGNFEPIRQEIKTIFQEGVADPVAKQFLLSADDMWILEQGSGAALWKNNDALCLKVYKPGQSDNDYELLFPLFVGQQWDPADPAEQTEFNRRAHDSQFMEGDWYFKPPVGLIMSGRQIVKVLGPPPDPSLNETVTEQAAFAAYLSSVTHWRYELPKGFQALSGDTNVVVPATGNFFKNPQTPAAIIAGKVLPEIAKSTPFRRKTFKDITLFPYRREHFLFAVPSLEKPPPFGDDPVGDAGMGRGFLFLKWVLEGAFLPSFSAGTADGKSFNETVTPDGPSVRKEIFDRLNARRDSLKLESYEWGAFQEFAALRGNVLLRMAHANGVPPGEDCRQIFGDFLAYHEALTLKKTAKAATRGMLAALARNDQALGEMFDVDPTEFDAAQIPTFEHFIASVAENHLDLVAPLSLAEVTNSVRLKVGDEEAVREMLAQRGGVDGYILNVLQLLRQVQAESAPDYLTALGGMINAGLIDEAHRRLLNAHDVDYGLATPNSSFNAGRMAMHGEDPNQSYTASFTFYVNLFNPTGRPTDPLTLTFNTDGSLPVTQVVQFNQGEVTRRLWGETSSGQSIPNPFVVRRDPRNTGPVTHVFNLTGMAPDQNFEDFNDHFTFESHFLSSEMFVDPAFQAAPNTVWVFRGLGDTATNSSLEASVITQLREGRLLSPFHLQDDDPDEESDLAVALERSVELVNITNLITNGAFVNGEFQNSDVLQMSEEEQIAVRHVEAEQPLAISTADSPLVSLRFTSSVNTANLLAAFEVDSLQAGIQFVPLAPDGNGHRPFVQLNREEAEHVFINKLAFKRALLFRVSERAMNNAQDQYTLQFVGEFPGQ
jgi:PKD repeat protein/pimeloyl-ACP methyl ester carboxylesterase